MADAVDSEERPPEGHVPELKIDYRAPTYSSDTYPRFPQELIDRICEFLRLDPFTLTKCRLVCHAWYHAALRVSGWDSQLDFQTREALDDCAHMLLSNGNRPYGKRFTLLTIVEDPRKPFMHVFPMRIPGYVLPQVKMLWLQGFDCAVTRPYDPFFRFLSYYTSITTLFLRQCYFRSITEVRRISNALPSLKELSLAYNTLQHPLVPDMVPRHVASPHNKLKKISINDENGELGAHCRETDQFLLGVCAAYSYVTELDLDLGYCSSFSQLHQCLSQLPHLSYLWLRGAFGSDVEPASAADMALYTAHAPNPSLSTFQLFCVPPPWASQLLKLWSTPQACSQLESLCYIYLLGFDSRTAALEFPLASADPGPRLTELLCFAGTALKTLTFECYVVDESSIDDAIPRLSVNTSLTILKVKFYVINLSLPMIQRALGVLLSNIQSPHLESFTINIRQWPCAETSEDGHDSEASAKTDPPGSTSTFHALLSRSVFDRLPPFSREAATSTWHHGVHLEVMKEARAQTALMSVIKSYMITLFAPWLDRGVIRLCFLPDPDGAGPVTQNPSSALWDLGTHASIAEIQDPEDDEHEGGARDASGITEAEEVEEELPKRTRLEL